MNTLSEQTLVDRATGGKGGGGAILTRYGQRLVQLCMICWRRSSKKHLMC